MPIVFVRDGDSFEGALKTFKKKCERAGILSDIKKHQRYEKPSDEKKRKTNEAKRKIRKLQRKMGLS